MSNFFYSLLLQGLGGLFLVLVCCTLYAYRRRAYFLFWTLSWLAFSLWLLLGTLKIHWAELCPDLPAWQPFLQDGAVVCGWWHALLWVIGTQHFWQNRVRRDLAPPDPVGEKRWFVLELTATAVVAVLASRFLSWAVRNALLSGCLAVVYAWSAALFALARRRQPRSLGVGALLLCVVSAVSTAERLLAAALHHWLGGAELSPDVLGPASFVDFLLKTFFAVGTIIVLLDDEQGALGAALARLADSEARFRLLFEHSGVGMALLTPQGQFLQTNRALGRFLGYTAEELRSRGLSDLVHRAEGGSGNGSINALLRGDAVLYEGEKRYRRKDGQIVWAKVVRVAVADDAGLARYHVGVLVDISERKRVEQTLREERDFSAQVLEAADALIFAVNPAGQVVRFNGKCAAVTGYHEQEVRGRPFWAFLLPEPFADQARAAFARLGEAGPDAGAAPDLGALNAELPLRTRAGEERRVAWRYTAVREARGRLRHVIVTGLDVTEQRRLEEQLQHAQKMETLGTLVGGIAHDFNNQLTAVLGNLDLAAAELRDLELARRQGEPGDAAPGGAPPPGQRLGVLLSDAEGAAQRCADMTQRLLTFGRRRVTQVQAVDPAALVREVVRLLQRLLPATIRIETHLAPEVWRVRADSTQLHQVLMNLAVNARDAMAQGGVLTLAVGNRSFDAQACARCVEARPGEFVELSVRDTGCGMAPEVQARIFEPFFTTKKFGEGTGLGLSMVFGLVKAHGGWITVQSEVKLGSVFRVYLPAEREGDTETRGRGDTETLERGNADRDSKVTAAPPCPRAPASHTVLVVDDEDAIRHLARSVLEGAGYRVLTAADGEEALQAYRGNRRDIDLVLLDYTMPKLTGLQVLEAMQALDPQVRVIFSSGYAVDSDGDRLLAAGARAFVAKPYRPADLVQAVRGVLEPAPSAARG